MKQESKILNNGMLRTQHQPNSTKPIRTQIEGLDTIARAHCNLWNSFIEESLQNFYRNDVVCAALEK